MNLFNLILFLARSFQSWMGQEFQELPDGRLEVRVRLSLDRRPDDETARLVVRDDALLPTSACAHLGLRYACAFTDRRNPDTP